MDHLREVVRWLDHWCKGMDTGIMDEPPVKYWVMGENAWRAGDDWPLPQTQWTKLYLTSWGRLRPEPFTSASNDGVREPDAFVQMPLKQTKEVAKRFAKLGWSSVLLIDGPTIDEKFVKAARNIPGVDVLPQQGANVYDILRRDTLVLTKDAVKHLEERLQ